MALPIVIIEGKSELYVLSIQIDFIFCFSLFSITCCRSIMLNRYILLVIQVVVWIFGNKD
jgi:hypothetical protein